VKHLKNSQQINYERGHENSYPNTEGNSSNIFLKESLREELPWFAAREQQYHRFLGSGRS
jgi:hypothetical protein